MKRKSLQHVFAQIPTANIQRSRFNRDHDYKTTFNEGLLVPFLVDEVLPGDTFTLKLDLLCRLLTPVVPFMDDLYLDTHFFYVPLRLVWDHFEEFMGAQKNPGDSTDYLIPQVEVTNPGIGSIYDYMGIPPTVTKKLSVSALWCRAYNLIWNEWFRDENLQDSVEVPMDDGPDDQATYTLLRRGKRHDYFTSALPWPQKGTAASISLTGNADIVGDGSPVLLPLTTPGTIPAQGLSFNPSGSKYVYYNASATSSQGLSTISWPSGPVSGLSADLSSATDVSINTLRQAFQIQKFLEKQARGGTRYREVLETHFGVRSPDARLQRPEYLGGGSSRIHITAVAQTSSTDNTSPQGNLSAFGVMGDSYHGFTKSFVEHGVLIGLVSVRAPLTYQQGINRMFLRRDLYDMYFPTFAHLGEQVVTQEEIYAQGTEDDATVFGYQERYAEYRYKPSLITGEFRSQAPQSLDVWHLAQQFETAPKLNSEFIQEQPPVDRVVAVPNRPHFFLDAYFHYNCVRPMPVYSVPGLVDHF